MPSLSPPLLPSVRFLARCVPQFSVLAHAVMLVSEFLDCRVYWGIARACELGDVELLRCLAKRQELFPSKWTEGEPLYRSWQFAKGSVVAAREGNMDVLRWLLTEFDTVSSATVAAEVAAKCGHLHILQYLRANFDDRIVWHGNPVVLAAENNHMKVAKWLVENTTARARWTKLAGVIKFADTNIIRWLHAMEVQFNEAEVAVAAEYGRLKTVKFMVQQWRIPLSSVSVDGAATNGHLEVVKWLLDHGASISAAAVTGAAANGHLRMLEWLHKRKIRPRDTSRRKKNPIWTPRAMDMAAINGHLNIVRWLHANRQDGCVRDATESANITDLCAHLEPSAMNGAAKNNHLPVIQWLHRHRNEGCTTDAMDEAAANGHMEVVKWLQENRPEGCTSRAMDLAAKNGHLEMVKWLHENRTEGCTTAAMDLAAANGHLEIVQWLHDTRSEGCTTKAMDCAAAGGHLHVVSWLHEARSEGCTVAAMDSAASGGYFRVMKWLHARRREGCSSMSIESAAGLGRLDMIEWLMSECGCQCTERAMENAVQNDRFNVILYFDYAGALRMLNRQLIGSSTAWMAARAASSGSLVVLQWLAHQDQEAVRRSGAYFQATRHEQAFCAQWLTSKGWHEMVLERTWRRYGDQLTPRQCVDAK